MTDDEKNILTEWIKKEKNNFIGNLSCSELYKY